MNTILFLGACPLDATRLALGNEVREIQLRLRAAELRSHFRVEQEWAVRPDDLQACLLRHRPDIVHFSGHGSTAGKLVLENADGTQAAIEPNALANLFRLLRRNIRCVVLNACFSADQAYEIAKHIDCVVGMTSAISDNAAISFASAFYQALGHGEDIQTAFDLGCNQIELSALTHANVPKLVSKCGVSPENVSLIRP